ncbi:hypothetical protein [uncultured Microscilla sp.]|uniref:hypothetical protein n=1 Tax=uncultured Microscilla sp. TaxID=432653 RepID=UPI002616F586|nr:hypothetical protein [uncultured Microscilla sp.]
MSHQQCLLFHQKPPLPKRSISWLMLGLLFVLASCNNEVDFDWQPKVVSPLVNGELGLFQQPDVKNISDDFLITATNVFGNQRGTVNSLPAIGPLNFPLEPTKISDNDEIDEVGLSNVKISLTITNRMPVTMASGAVITLTSAGASTAFAETTIGQDIAPGTSQTFTINQNSGVLKNTFVVSLNNFKTLATNDPVTITDNSQVSMKLQFDPPTVDYIQFIAGKSSTFDTQFDFDAGLDQQNTEDVSGDLVVDLKNQVAIDFNLNINFLDASGGVLGTVFPGGLELSANQSVVRRIGGQTIINNLQAAKKIQVKAVFNPTIANRKLTSDAKILYKLIGDLQFKVKVK